MRLGERIRDLRRKKDWRQIDLAKRIGVTAAAVSQMEQGVRQPSLESLTQLADALEVTVDELLGRAGGGRRDPAWDAPAFRALVTIFPQLTKESQNSVARFAAFLLQDGTPEE